METQTMRPIASEQDPLRYPLNEIFGTQAHVRVLRVMAVEVEGPLTASDIARRTGLTVPGAQKSLGRLLRTGFISRVGGGRKHQYEIRRSDRLMQIAIELFQSEKNRYERLLSAIKNEIKNLTPPPHAAWIQAIPREIDEPLILEWRNILDTYSIQRLVRFVMSSSERAKRLRQSNPFFAILTTDERSMLAAELGEQA
jgi:predicted transcriptional regulator